jgi:hypothetical protein
MNAFLFGVLGGLLCLIFVRSVAIRLRRRHTCDQAQGLELTRTHTHGLAPTSRRVRQGMPEIVVRRFRGYDEVGPSRFASVPPRAMPARQPPASRRR